MGGAQEHRSQTEARIKMSNEISQLTFLSVPVVVLDHLPAGLLNISPRFGGVGHSLADGDEELVLEEPGRRDDLLARVPVLEMDRPLLSARQARLFRYEFDPE